MAENYVHFLSVKQNDSGTGVAITEDESALNFVSYSDGHNEILKGNELFSTTQFATYEKDSDDSGLGLIQVKMNDPLLKIENGTLSSKAIQGIPSEDSLLPSFDGEDGENYFLNALREWSTIKVAPEEVLEALGIEPESLQTLYALLDYFYYDKNDDGMINEEDIDMAVGLNWEFTGGRVPM